ncbi:DegV family protein [Longirhabdus pacifica]|uniref:DegV family protein n=1 Tax=Longirhabdus pacifica TaxID=2305227 RepID=UPI0013E8D02B|nr:DegV family protein [Longirhabdus pacifica]
MTKIAWVTDSSAYIPEDLLDHKDIYVIPLTIIFDQTSYQDGVDISNEQIYDMIEKSSEIPKTSQPPLAAFIQMYEKLQQDYDAIISIHLSSEFSGTYQSSCIAAKMTDFPIEVVDSKILSYPITLMIMKGMKLHKQGLSIKEIAEVLRSEHQNMNNYIIVGNLKQLQKGGRINSFQRMIGSLLKIYPVLQVLEGKVHIFGKLRTKKRAVAAILEQFSSARDRFQISNIQILHADALEEANKLKQHILNMYKDLHILVGPLSPTIGVHGGKDSLVLAWSIDS